jgi:hypothetical protein
MSTGVDNRKVGVDNRKVGVDNEKALELDNRIFLFHISASFNMQQNILLHSGMITPNILV